MRPPFNHGMTALDRSKFSVCLQLLMAEINPKLIGVVNKESSELLDLRGVNKVVFLGGSKKGILFKPEYKAKQDLPPRTQELLSDAIFSNYKLTLDYDHWTMEQVLRSILPRELEDVPTGFTIVGHIAHLNLRDQYLPYKRIIGQIVLDKNPSVRTVVNKLDSIDTVFRTFDMEVLAGDEDFWVEHRESNCRFQFDFRKVYWNSRLHSEHERLVRQFRPGSAVCDPFAGVGPFAVPAAKKGVLVLANDLNPESVKAMRTNVGLNKVKTMRCFNEDARAFIRGSMQRLEALRREGPIIKDKKEVPVPDHFEHFVMNLPATAIEFLDAFRGLYDSEGELPLPMIHVHCFHKHEPGAEPTQQQVESDLAARISAALGHEVAPQEMGFHDVRKVAPTKEMYCVSFRLPREVAYVKRKAAN